MAQGVSVKLQRSTAQHSTAQHSTAQHSTAQLLQHSAAQRSTVQYITAQRSGAVRFKHMIECHPMVKYPKMLIKHEQMYSLCTPTCMFFSHSRFCGMLLAGRSVRDAELTLFMSLSSKSFMKRVACIRMPRSTSPVKSLQTQGMPDSS